LAACKECERLWEEYAEATKAHLKIIGEHQVAKIEQNSIVIDALDPLYREFEKRRALARMALKDHEAKAHEGRPATQR